MGFYESFIQWTEQEPHHGEEPTFERYPGALEIQVMPESGFGDDSVDRLTAQFFQDEEGVSQAFDHIEANAESDPYHALAQASVMTAIVNRAAAKTQRLERRLSNAIARLQAVLAKIKQAVVGAVSYTISVGFPLGVSIGVTFT